jgi:hypothetical protein
MKYYEKIIVVFFSGLLAFLLSASARGFATAPERPLPVVEVRVLTLYDVCVDGTIVPASRLRAHARAESEERDDKPGDGGLSISRFQLYETPKYHAWRAQRWGEYNPHDPGEAGRIAALFIQDIMVAFPGDEAMQMTAYRWGIEGARAHGVDEGYVERVRARI